MAGEESAIIRAAVSAAPAVCAAERIAAVYCIWIEFPVCAAGESIRPVAAAGSPGAADQLGPNTGWPLMRPRSGTARFCAAGAGAAVRLAAGGSPGRLRLTTAALSRLRSPKSWAACRAASGWVNVTGRCGPAVRSMALGAASEEAAGWGILSSRLATRNADGAAWRVASSAGAEIAVSGRPAGTRCTAAARVCPA